MLDGATTGGPAALVADRGFEEDRSGRRQVAAILLENARNTAPAQADVRNNAGAPVR
ncbi:hypothetical protein [Streptomyces sp. NPDC051997]|uniref:hypothetical protein n=1 Tax=Streptomyces sp. NPDC051997 TaxID=3155611 RepID=UPI00343E3BB2